MLQAEEANGQAAATQPANDAAPTAAAASAPIISISSLPLPSATPQAHSTSPARESADAEAQDLIVKQTPASDALILPDATSSSPRSYQPPTDRWTPADPHDNGTDPRSPAPSFSRSTVSSGSATTSNALIIPNVPSVADAMGPLTSTGEILVTGSIDLPRSLGATGQRSDRFDSSDIDRLFEQPEAGEQTESTVAPIRASRAVSTHTSTRDVITPRRTYGNKLPTVLAITAAVLALGVVGLLVAGYILKVF
jgi:hypothetical protein